MLKALKRMLWTLRIALPKVAVGWMFALLTIDFNRVAIVELGLAAVVVTTLLSVHYFLAPFQVIAGRLADCHPLFGYRRSPYLLGASLLASLLFLALPSVSFSMSEGATGSLPVGVLVFVLFGLCMAVIADSYHALIAENTDKQSRPMVIAVVWIVMILSTILSAAVMNAVRPEFSREAMQRLYNLTPFIVVASVLVGIYGMEKRLPRDELRAAMYKARSLAPPGNPLVSAVRLIRAHSQTRLFFAFVAVSIFGIFLQESIIEVFGAEVFDLGVRETTRLQPIWGAGILLGMLLTGLVSAIAKLPRQRSTLIGCLGAVIGFVALGGVALFQMQVLLIPVLFYLGFCAGVFNVGALALMMDMTVEGATGLYMGLWGVAQALGMGLSAVVAGAMHTLLVASEILPAPLAYAGFFAVEALLLVAAARALTGIRVDLFQRQATARSSIEVRRIDDPTAGTLGTLGA